MQRRIHTPLDPRKVWSGRNRTALEESRDKKRDVDDAALRQGRLAGETMHVEITPETLQIVKTELADRVKSLQAVVSRRQQEKARREDAGQSAAAATTELELYAGRLAAYQSALKEFCNSLPTVSAQDGLPVSAAEMHAPSGP